MLSASFSVWSGLIFVCHPPRRVATKFRSDRALALLFTTNESRSVLMVPRWVLCVLMSLGFAALGIGCGSGEIEPEVPIDEQQPDPAAERQMIMENRRSRGSQDIP